MSTWSKKELLFKSDRTLVYRAYDSDAQVSFIVKSMTREHPSQGELSRFFHEYEMLSRLSSQGVIPAREKISFEGHHSLLFPDHGGMSLAQLVVKPGQPMELASFFKIAIPLAQTLGEVHSKGMIHKDINPNNLLSLPDFSASWIIDFGIASQAKREVQTLKPVDALEGTLDYLPPEQSGRVNRSLDYRADYYALGITFFELLSGKKPFHSNDTMELLHAHMVAPLPELTEVRRDIPASLAQVIKKLAAKDPDDRYQSTWGLVFDLNRCYRAWSSGDRVGTFALGQEDSSERLVIPEKIYGREREIQALLKIFNESQAFATGKALDDESEDTETLEIQGHLTLIAGPSGVGKSALVHELVKPVSEKGGYLVEGKVDQFQRAVLLYGFKSALISFFDLLAGDSLDLLGKIKTDLVRKLKSNIGVITDTMPELATYLGDYETPGALKPDDTLRRLLDSFATLFACIAKRKPLVLFIDDLQWADLTTLDLVEHLTKRRIPGFMLMGAYRTNEVAEGQPFHSLLKNLGAGATIFQLQPLKEAAVHQLLTDTLGQSESLGPVTQMMIQKTGANPFFVHQLLKQLYSDELITRDPIHKLWRTDLVRLAALQVSPNVAEFLLAKLKTLDQLTQDILSAGAAYGARFDYQLIARLLGSRSTNSGEPPTTGALVSAFQTAVDQEFIRPVLGNYQHLVSSGQADSTQVFEFQFLHDRIQQASYELKTEAAKKTLHFKIAELLAAGKKKPDVIAIAEQYLKSDLSHVDDNHRLKISKTLFEAAVQTKNSSGFKKALEYIQSARALCSDPLWNKEPTWMRTLYLELSEIHFRAGDFSECTRINEILLNRSKDNFDKAEVYALMTEQARVDNRNADSVKFGLKGLSLLGIQLRENTSTFEVFKTLGMTLYYLNKVRAKGNRLLPLLEKPVLKERGLALATVILSASMESAYYLGNKNLFLVGGLLSSQFSFRYGLFDSTLSSFGSFFVILNSMEKYQITQELMEVALKLFTHPEIKNRNKQIDGYFRTLAFTGHIHLSRSELVDHFFRVFELGFECRVPLATSGFSQALGYLAQTSPLSDLNHYASYLNRIEAFGYQQSICGTLGAFAFYECLAAPSLADRVRLREKLEGVFVRANSIGSLTASVSAAYQLSLDHYLFSTPRQAKEFFEKHRTGLSALVGLMIELRFKFFHALALLAVGQESKSKLSWKERRILLQVRKKFKGLAEFNPRTFSFYHQFLEAEFSFYKKAPEKTVTEHYRRAISSARQDGNLFFEALISEKAGAYYLAQGNGQVGAFYIVKAHSVYTRWEAWARVRYLEEKFPELFQEIAHEKSLGHRHLRPTRTSQASSTSVSTSTSHGTISEESQSLDFNEVLKAAQSLSSEVLLSRLTEKLLKIVSEVSGAERGVLLLPDPRGNFSIHSHFGAFTPENSSTQEIRIPASILDRVRLKKETLILADAMKDSHFKKDPSFTGKGVRSIVCMPSMTQGKITAILYLENNSVAGAFTEKQIKTLGILTSQVAVSIENAKLYETLEDQVKEKTRDIQAILQNLQQGIFTLQQDFTIHPEYAAYLEVILGTKNLAGKDPLPLLLNHPTLGASTQSEILSVLATTLGQSQIDFDLNAHLLPTQLVRIDARGKDQHLELDWKPLLNSDKNVERVLVTLRDVTELRRLQVEAREQKTELEMIGEILECGFGSFQSAYHQARKAIDENRKLLRNVKPDGLLPQEVTQQLFINLHTIKGNARSIGLSFAVDTIHEAEHVLDTLRGSKTAANLRQLETDLQRVEAALERYSRLAETKLIGVGGTTAYPSSATGILDTLKADTVLELSADEALRLLKQFHTSLRYQPLNEILATEIHSLPGIARTLGKPAPSLKIQNDPYFSVDHARILKDVFTHCFRNSLDHGLETPGERQTHGKPEAGTLTLAVREEDAGYSLVFSDDGRGLNLHKIMEKGIKSGACNESASDGEISELIFQSGISTAEKVTDISGRGVGMDAVRSFIQNAGGKIGIEFTGEKTADGFRPFQLVLSIPAEWVRPAISLKSSNSNRESARAA